MTLDELEAQLRSQFRPQPTSFINMKKVLCMCHYKWVWVSSGESLPYWCPQGQLHAALAESSPHHEDAY